MTFDEIYRATDILCFECNKRYGIECAGRNPDESTLCVICFHAMMAKEKFEEELHMNQIQSQSKNNQSSTQMSSGGSV